MADIVGSSARMVLCLVLVSALVCYTSAEFAGFDGRPRPKSMSDEPTSTLGAKPAVKYKGRPANCIWYDWENPFYEPKDTKNCSSLLWASLTADPSGLEAYSYYISDLFYDPQADEYLCAIGCFDLSATGGPSPAPSTSKPPASPPVAATPPPVMASPPMSSPPMSPPPSSPPADVPSVPPTTAPPSASPPMMAPPPATLFRPPPPALPLAPSSIDAPATGPTQATSPSGAPGPSQATGPSQAPGPSTPTSAGSALRIFPAFVLAAAVLQGLAF